MCSTIQEGKAMKEVRLSCFFLKGCFGCSQDKNNAENSIKCRRSNRDTSVSTSSSSYVIGSSKTLENNKMHDTMLEKSAKLLQLSGEMIGDPIKLSHSVSMPLPRSRPRPRPRPKGRNGNDLITGDEIDSMFGALIVVMTLIVMLVWGNLCAIICSAACLYFIPRFNGVYDINLENTSEHIDIHSWEYKKKVVFDGFLQRNRHL